MYKIDAVERRESRFSLETRGVLGSISPPGIYWKTAKRYNLKLRWLSSQNGLPV
jgi:hypothetical protein